MKATLTIEVPDSFEKGDCWQCQLLNEYKATPKQCYERGYDADNCPLEI